MKTHAAWIAFLPLLICSCGHESDWATRVDWHAGEGPYRTDPALIADADAVILLDDGRMEIFGGDQVGFSAFERHTIVRILNNRGQRFANVVIPYSTGSRVEDIQARTVSPDGKITLLDEKNIFDVNLFPNYILFSDERSKIFTLPGVTDGAVVEYRYKLTIPNRMFWHSWRFQNDVPTVHSRFALVKPSEWEVRYRTYGTHVEPSTVKTPEGFKSTHVWELNNVSPLRPEVMMPPYAECVARLALAPAGFKTWEDVSKWYSGLSASRMKAGTELRDLAATLLKGATDERDKLHRIFEWVRDNIRYVAVEIDIGGFQPHAAGEVCLNRYGDCKDMVTLLCALGKEAGMDMRQVLVSTRQNGEPDTSLASPLQFNHAIAYCPSVDDGVWMDATDKGCPFGQLPWYDQGVTVLVVDEKGEPELKRTSKPLPIHNRRITTWEAVLDTAGDATVRGRSTFTGAEAIEMRNGLLYAPPDAIRLQLETWLARRCDGVRLDTFVVVNPLPALDTLRLEYTFTTKQLAVRRDGVMAVKPGLIGSPEMQMYFRTPRRIHPIRFEYGGEKDLDVTIIPPRGWTSPGKGLADSVVTRFARAGWKWQTGAKGLRYQSYYHLDGQDIVPSLYPDWQAFLDRVQEESQREIVFIRNE